MTHHIIAFYLEQNTDHAGRYLHDVLSYSDQDLEDTHDYIQWLFPLVERSKFNPFAPVLNADTQARFRRDSDLQAILCTSCHRMLQFYGLVCDAPKPPASVVALQPSFDQVRHQWMTPNNHNHLRLTRILKSLQLLGLEKCSRSIYQRLIAIASNQPSSFTATTLRIWQQTQSDIEVRSSSEPSAPLCLKEGKRRSGASLPQKDMLKKILRP
jgi:hypothetical protein